MEKNRGVVGAMLFYAIIIGLLFIPLPPGWRSGPCTPGVDFLLMLVVGPVSLLLVTVSLIRRFVFKKNSNTIFVHGLAFIAWLVALKTM